MGTVPERRNIGPGGTGISCKHMSRNRVRARDHAGHTTIACPPSSHSLAATCPSLEKGGFIHSGAWLLQSLENASSSTVQ